MGALQAQGVDGPEDANHHVGPAASCFGYELVVLCAQESFTFSLFFPAKLQKLTVNVNTMQEAFTTQETYWHVNRSIDRQVTEKKPPLRFYDGTRNNRERRVAFHLQVSEVAAVPPRDSTC